ncbi:MAG: CHASE2 domain-containing protein [Cyanobacteria bacterium P01_A01_bin.83]
MSYCINPWCFHRQNPDELEFCQSCHTSLIINERYRIIRPLRESNQHHHTEIFEIDNLGTTKVLKVLTSDRHRLLELFEQEANILKQLKHLDVPLVETYFTFSLQDSGKQLHCLVMEKIPGQNLQQWLANNEVLSEELALNWLLQLTEFLEKLHQAEILHRDIKPSNIMLRPDGRLVLIDFGTARRITITYAEKLEQGDLTRVYTCGYTAPEQIEGQARYQSDFFALGRTFLHLLTKTHPDRLLQDPQTNKLIWRSQATQISVPLANLLDELITPVPQQRLERPHLLVKKIKLNRELSTQELPSGGQLPRFNRARGNVRSFNLTNNTCSKLAKMLCISLAVALMIVGIRSLGWLQTFEISAFDRFMELRPIEQTDSRFLIVTINEDDIQYQNQQGMPVRGSLSDEALLLLLKKLDRSQARTIGIDIYRDFPVNPQYGELKTYLHSSQNLFAPCKVPAPEDGDSDGIAPPPEVPKSRIGFSDFVADDREIVRRHLINLTPTVVSACAPEMALSLQIALHYLQQQGIKTNVTPDGQLKIGEVLLKPLDNHTSGYQNFDASGYQILLNYRSLTNFSDIAQQISLKEILNNSNFSASELTQLFEDRIVLIGVTAPSSTDSWNTPFSKGVSIKQEIPGVFIQAHAISQVVSAVLDKRSLIWWWSDWLEFIWIWGWSGLGIVLVLVIRRPLKLGLAIAVALLLLFAICFGIFIQAGWIPMIPAALALIITSVVIVRGNIHFSI